MRSFNIIVSSFVLVLAAPFAFGSVDSSPFEKYVGQYNGIEQMPDKTVNNVQLNLMTFYSKAPIPEPTLVGSLIVNGLLLIPLELATSDVSQDHLAFRMLNDGRGFGTLFVNAKQNTLEGDIPTRGNRIHIVVSK